MPKLVASLADSLDGAHHAAVAITTTDLVSKSAALEVRVLDLPGMHCKVTDYPESIKSYEIVWLLITAHHWPHAQPSVALPGLCITRLHATVVGMQPSLCRPAHQLDACQQFRCKLRTRLTQANILCSEPGLI